MSRFGISQEEEIQELRDRCDQLELIVAHIMAISDFDIHNLKLLPSYKQSIKSLRKRVHDKYTTEISIADGDPAYARRIYGDWLSEAYTNERLKKSNRKVGE